MTMTTGQRQVKTVRCPYMPEHIMPQQSLLNHLSKCSATNKHLFTKCRYNPLHVYPNNLIDEHYKKCKDRIKYQEKHGQSSDDWGSEQEKNQEPQIVEIPEKRQGNRKNDKKNSQILNESTIQKLSLSSSDDQSWDPIIKDLSQNNLNVSKTVNQSTLNNSRGNRTNQSKDQTTNKQSKIKSQKNSFQQKSYVSKKNNRIFQQQKSLSIQKKQQEKGYDELLSLNSQSFSTHKNKSFSKQSQHEDQKSGQTLKSFTSNEKSRDNQKQNSQKCLSKSIAEENFQVDDF